MAVYLLKRKGRIMSVGKYSLDASYIGSDDLWHSIKAHTVEWPEDSASVFVKFELPNVGEVIVELTSEVIAKLTLEGLGVDSSEFIE